MTSYLADSIQAAARVKIPRRLQPVEAGSLIGTLEKVARLDVGLQQRELYAFDVSALNAASDLRIDTPERLERLVEAVLRSPRQIYMEADLSQMAVIGDNIRGVLGGGRTSARQGGLRWGAMVDVLGDGRARFRNMLLLPSGWLKSDPSAGPIVEELKSLPGSLRTSGLAASQIYLDPVEFSIDLSRKVGMSKGEFEFALTRISGGGDPVFRFAQQELARADGKRAKGRIVDAAWQAMRLRDLIRQEGGALPAEDGLTLLQADLATRTAGYDGLSFGLPVIGLLALLQAESSDIRLAPKTAPRRQAGARVPRGERRQAAPGVLSVVTLNLEDRGLQKLYDGSGGMPGSDAGAASGRVRHPVRGHLFLARNGIMTWRKPHWRGSIDKAVLHRVVAPSHR